MILKLEYSILTLTILVLSALILAIINVICLFNYSLFKKKLLESQVPKVCAICGAKLSECAKLIKEKL